MANDTLINLLAWCKRERERLQMQREMLQSGRFRIFETEESGQKDISNQHVEQITDCRIGWDHSWVHSLMPSDDPVTLGLVSTRQQQNSR